MLNLGWPPFMRRLRINVSSMRLITPFAVTLPLPGGANALGNVVAASRSLEFLDHVCSKKKRG